ncbi:nuclear transport factor 2 family protein [Hyphococcus formosus]|uniref:nuclear transport factor 2 family protein n=1 Tax=Hyphococcus formosus TaxID=3143534 RepID=UPI00398B445E
MKRALSGISFFIGIAAAGAALAETDKTSCVRGSDARVIEVLTPGNVGQSCDVRYTRGGGSNVSVPYHANNSDSFCIEKANAIVTRLKSAGFTCTVSKPALRAETTSAPVSDYVVDTTHAPTQEASSSSIETMDAPVPLAMEPVGGTASTGDYQQPQQEDDVLEERMSQILAQPSLAEPSGEPAVLVEQRAETSNVRHAPIGSGRMLGAAPDAPKPATAVTTASLAQEPAQPVTTPTVVSSQQSPADNSVPQLTEKKEPKKPTSVLRTPQEVILASIFAQAAAWNEGNLEAFMETYWKSDDLKFVSNTSITRGWSSTMKRYRETYGGGATLGQLGFEKLDVKMITDDVATVTGRFNLDQDGELSSGTFSLVMRRDNGAWRIVHDHTSSDE